MEKLNFTIQNAYNPSDLLAEAVEIVQYSNLELGEGTLNQEANGHKKQVLEGLQELAHDFEKDLAYFGKKLDVHHLTQDDFKKQNIEMSHDLSARMEKYDFYHINIPVTLFPRSGWAFTKLECELQFCPKENDPHQCPIIYEMFPEDVWTEILNFQDNLEIGLDANLTYRAQIAELNTELEQLGEEAKAKLALKAQTGAKLVAGPFSYHIRRTMIRTSGKLDSRGFWRLESKEYVDEENVSLSVVVMVPKNLNEQVDALGNLKAYYDFQKASADLKKDWPRYIRHWIKFFGPQLKAFFNGGAHISSVIEWKNIMRSTF